MKIIKKSAAVIFSLMLSLTMFTACDDGSGADDIILNSEKSITSFIFETPYSLGIINQGSREIIVTIWGDISALTPTINHTGASIFPESGVPNNFLIAQTYVVTAEDGTTQEYTVTVTQKEYGLRDRGPAGGWIFYINPSAASYGWKYLEAAPVDINPVQWGASNQELDTYEGISSGLSNTLKIVDFHNMLIPDDSSYSSYYDNDFTVNTSFNDSSYTFSSNSDGTVAAKECTEYGVVCIGATYNDWFLPSYWQIHEMYENLYSEGIGDLAENFYWSSSEYSSTGAWGKNMITGNKVGGPKTIPGGVRAVRRF